MRKHPCNCKGQDECCQICGGTGWVRPDADRRANVRFVRQLAEWGRGYLVSGRAFR